MTVLYLHHTNDAADISVHTLNTIVLATSRGTTANTDGVTSSPGPATVYGSYRWISAPLDADVSIPANTTLTFNVWASESSMSANATVGVLVEQCDSLGSVLSTISSVFGTELGTSLAAKNWSTTLSARTFHKGDRIKVTVFFTDATGVTMGNGYTLTVGYGSASSGSSGDTYIDFSGITMGFLSVVTPATPTTKFWLDTKAAANLTADYDKQLSRTDPASRTGLTTNTVTGPATVQIGAPSGKSVWWTEPLDAVSITAGSIISFYLWGYEDNALAQVAWLLEVYKTDGMGANEVAIISADSHSELVVNTGYASGNSKVVYAQVPSTVDLAQGDRLRLRVYGTDIPYGVMATGYSFVLDVGGISQTYCDTWIGFEQTLTDAPPATARVPRREQQYPQLLAG